MAWYHAASATDMETKEGVSDGRSRERDAPTYNKGLGGPSQFLSRFDP